MWNYFAPIDADFAKYYFCKQKLSYRSFISNLMKHLQNRHQTTSVARIFISHVYEAQVSDYFKAFSCICKQNCRNQLLARSAYPSILMWVTPQLFCCFFLIGLIEKYVHDFENLNTPKL
jgi:hypothetical protein